MYLSRIIVSNFKNITGADITFSPKINCICGDNGEGKTNFLDAVYYLSMTKSFLSTSDRYTFTYGETETVLHGDYVTDSGAEDIAVAVKNDGTKTVRRNGKAYKRISEHIGKIPVVMTAPSDVALIHDSGEERRRFLNMMISQMDQEYLRAVVSYNRLLRQRNSLLKQDNVPDILLDTVSARRRWRYVTAQTSPVLTVRPGCLRPAFRKTRSWGTPRPESSGMTWSCSWTDTLSADAPRRDSRSRSCWP